MRYAKIYKCDISNGPGFRVSLFTQGCTHCCEGCFNPETWDLECGKEFDLFTEESIMKEISHEYINGLSILGGDPLVYYEDDIYNKYISSKKGDYDKLFHLVWSIKFHFPEKTIWLWTGYKWEDFFKDDNFSIHVQHLLEYIDVVVDGKYEKDKHSLYLKYAGSTNQRVIDVQKSLEKKEVVLYTE